MEKRWNQFEKRTSDCYADMITKSGDIELWNETFEVLLDIIKQEREEDPEYAKELYELDESTDYDYDVEGWLEDYMDELGTRGYLEKLISVCETLLGLFQWKEVSPSEYRLQIAWALRNGKELEKAKEFCEKWYQEDSGDVMAQAALILVCIDRGDFETAAGLAERHLKEHETCTAENEILFLAADTLYTATGDKKAGKRIKKAIKEFEKEMQEFLDVMEDAEPLEF